MKLLAMAGRSRYARYLCCTLLLAATTPGSAAGGSELNLEEAVRLAQDNDPWLTGSELRQHALEAQSTAAGSLPDPVVNLGFANLPTDSWDFDQEAMTQFKVGVSQMFPRGDTRALDSKRLALLGSQQPLRREDRRAQVAVSISQLWLEAYRARESIRLIEADRELFEHLVDVAESSYASALGRTRQQDLVRAQLELTRLEDRLASLHERHEVARSQLGEWLRPVPPAGLALDPARTITSFELVDELPEVRLLQPQLYSPTGLPPAEQVASYLSRHPAIVSIDREIAAGRAGVELAEQKYRPQWQLNASYGYREDDPWAMTGQTSSPLASPSIYRCSLRDDRPTTPVRYRWSRGAAHRTSPVAAQDDGGVRGAAGETSAPGAAA